MESISTAFADFICNTRYDTLPPEVVTEAKYRILDLIGVSLGGYKLMEFPRLVVDYVTSLGGIPEATIIETKHKVPAINAALANGACAHALEMDDGHRIAAIHPGTVVIPAAIAAGEMSGATTKEMITGVVIGYEVVIRISMGINPSSLQRGFHVTGTVGPFGAAAAAANIMNLSHQETVGALGSAGLQGAGLLQANHEVEGSKVKPMTPARAAVSGLLSSILSKKGAQGPRCILEGEDGFLRAMADNVKKEALTRDLGQTFEIGQSYYKFYAACRHAHAPMDAALQACHIGGVDPRQITRISVETYPAAVRLAGIVNASTPSAARFSIPFSVALVLLKGEAGADQYMEGSIADADIQGLASKVQLSVSRKWSELYPEKRGATVSITDGNKEWSAEVGLAKGEPENPASREDIYRKFYTNATSLVSEQRAARLGDIIMNLENSSVDELVGRW